MVGGGVVDGGVGRMKRREGNGPVRGRHPRRLQPVRNNSTSTLRSDEDSVKFVAWRRAPESQRIVPITVPVGWWR